MKYVGFLTLILLISGCTRPVETRISSVGTNDVPVMNYVWGTKIVAEEAAGANALMEVRLKNIGLNSSDAAPLRLDVTFSALPAVLKLTVGNVASGAATVKPPHASRKCKPVEYRLGFALSKVSDGTIAYRASAAEYHCKGDLRNILPVLADAVVADIGKPKGVYSTKRKLAR